jgi:hypothetical protein
MATLVSPGVSVSVTDESFYSPAGAGTVPLIVIATAENKATPDGTGTAPYTTTANANEVYLITSQRDLLQNYGNPNFKVIGGTPIHGDETNEYGLAAAYSFLGISNRAYVLRADIDLAQLEPSAVAPTSAPANRTLWLDLSETVWGIKRYDGAEWVSVGDKVKVPASTDLQPNGIPKSAFGVNGDIAVRYFNPNGTVSSSITFYGKAGNAWFILGSGSWFSATSTDFQFASHLAIPTSRSIGGALQAGDTYIQTTSPNQGTSVVVKEYSASASQFVNKVNQLFASSRFAYDSYIASGNLERGAIYTRFADTNPDIAILNIRAWNGQATLTVESSAAISSTALSNSLLDAGNVAFNIYINNSTTPVEVYLQSSTDGFITADDVVADIQAALSSANVGATFATQLSASSVNGKVRLVNNTGRNIELSDGTSGFSLTNINLVAGLYSNFEAAVYTPAETAPTGSVANGALWYDPDISTPNVDMLIHDGDEWVTLDKDFQTRATTPELRSNGTSLQTGDVWLDSSDTENLAIYKYNTVIGDWVRVNLTDQSSPNGILFADFRQSANSALDSDAPPASLYPAGMLGWNYRASGGNVKQWVVNYIYEGEVVGNVWVSYSGNQVNGAPWLLRKAQRRAVVKGLQAALVSNQDIRNEINRFNIVVTPGYPECIDEMIGLSVDRKDTVFAIVDTPMRLDPSGSSVQNWANNANNAVENGEDGLVSASSQAAIYYPSGLSTNLDGTNIMVPASHIALRTIAFNDQVAFPWFAPAGFQRGLVSNATSVGYLDSAENEFVPVSLNEGQRDVLYLNKVNPITAFPGRGLVVFGQKTLSPVASALDRINVSRLVIYIREQLDDAVKPFLFEPNDPITRTNAKTVVDRILSELVTQRGLYDFVTVCDESNNTPARIDRNELHIDIAIQPVKAVEFIYIPIRIQNTLGSTG